MYIPARRWNAARWQLSRSRARARARARECKSTASRIGCCFQVERTTPVSRGFIPRDRLRRIDGSLRNDRPRRFRWDEKYPTPGGLTRKRSRGRDIFLCDLRIPDSPSPGREREGLALIYRTDGGRPGDDARSRVCLSSERRYILLRTLRYTIMHREECKRDRAFFHARVRIHQ